MHQKNDVEATEIVDVMQREKNRVLGGSVIIIDADRSPLLVRDF